MKKLKLMQYWGGAFPPVGLSQRMEFCKANNPELRYKLIRPIGAAKRLNYWFGEEIANSFLSIRMEAMRSDIFRVAWVLKRGGYYVDAASQVLGPFSEWVCEEKLTLLKKPHMVNTKGVWNGFIYSPEAANPFLQEVWSRQKHVLLSRSLARSIWNETGPGLFRDILKNTDPQVSSSINILLPGEFDQKFKFGSSSMFFDKNHHWSRRESRRESYFAD